MPELAAPARLLLVFILDFIRAAPDGLAVRDLRFHHVDFDAILRFQALDDDLKVKLSLTADDRLVQLRVDGHDKRRILLMEGMQARGDPVLIPLRFRHDCHADHRLREFDRREDHGKGPAA